MLWQFLFLNQFTRTRVNCSSIAFALDGSEITKYGVGPHNDGKKANP